MAYKVLIRKGFALFSCRTTGAPCTVYHPGIWMKPSYGPSLVFKKLEGAISFSKDTCGTRDIIYRCKTTGLKKVDRLATGKGLFFKEFWRCQTSPQVSRFLAPEGTYSAEKVMLTKKVWSSPIGAV